MIPYVELDRVEIGPIVIAPFGALVVIGVLVGYWHIRRRARAVGIPEQEVRGATIWSLAVGLVLAHWVSIIFYFPDRLTREGPIVLLKLWQDLSSVGGFVGIMIGFVLWARWHKRREWLPYLDVMIQGLIVGWVFGRLACSIAHDHPGKLTTFFLGMQYPDGLRHDLGFYELLLTVFVLLPVSWAIGRSKLPTGSTVAAMAILYAPPRFFLDFLRREEGRNADLRYLGLTIAQYATLALLGVGIYLVVLLWKRQHAPEPIAVENKRAANRARRKKKR